MMGQSESSSAHHGRRSVSGTSRSADWVGMAEAALVGSGALPRGVPTFPAAYMHSSGTAVPPPVADQLPVGKQFFGAMQQAWRAPVPEVVAAAQQGPQDAQMDPDDILDAIQETPGDVLSPPVRLGYMIDCLIELWDDEGLYD